MIPRVVATIEARMSSSRLPGKVLVDICGKPAIERQVDRMRGARRLDDIVLATTVSAADDDLVSWAEGAGVSYFRGSEEDVLGRVVGAQVAAEADVCVPVCGDCPLLDPAVVDMAVETFLESGCDFVTNSVPPGFPQGQDVQVVWFKVLSEIAETIDDSAVHEHTCLYLHEHPELYRTVAFGPPDGCRMPDQRLQLDYPEDRELIRAVFSAFLPGHGDHFGVAEIVEFLRNNRAIADLNRNCEERETRPESSLK